MNISEPDALCFIYDCSTGMTVSMNFQPRPGILNPGIVDDLLNSGLSNITPQLKRTMDKLFPA